MSKPRLTIALAGNPNSGKTTLFNAITGARQHVGNYPGVTVERKEGSAEHRGTEVPVVDLPGAYSLTPYSAEELICRDFVLDERPGVVVDVVDASNLERNLYLATQFLELGVPLVLALNMWDLTEARGIRIDPGKLSELLGVPVIATVASQGKGIADLLDAAVATAARDGAVAAQHAPEYGEEIEPHVRQLTAAITDRLGEVPHARWFAVKLLEQDEQTAQRLRKLRGNAPAVDAILSEADRIRRHARGVFNEPPEIVLADRRYGFINGACAESVTRTTEPRLLRTDRLDGVLLNRYLGLPIFLLMVFLAFQLTFLVGNPLVGLLEEGKDSLAGVVRGWGAPGNLLTGLLADGVIEGIGSVLQFVPLIAMLYLMIAILEDSGYMARAAFLLDRLMHRIGLHGKSFIPMLIGFGCTIPAILATRTLETRRDRLTTMMVLPLMSCGARLPVYVLILGALFPQRTWLRLAVGDAELLAVTNQAVLLLGIYLTGIVLAVVCTKVLRKTVFRGEATPFVMELPPYRMPVLKGLAIHVWERTRLYLRKAGTILLAIVIILWALKTWPLLPEDQAQAFRQQRDAVAGDPALSAEQRDARAMRIDVARHQAELRHSAVGRIGQFLAPVMRPCGLDWKVATALVGSLAAKEVFVGQMGVIYAIPEHQGAEATSLRDRLSADYTALQGLCIMLFILIASPCAATLAAVVRESGRWKWAALQWTYLTVLGWTAATAVYQLGRLIGA